MKCWCGRPLMSAEVLRCDQGHDPYGIYLCSCGLHLFSTEQSTSPGAWARHQAHMAEFLVRIQARVDVAIAAGPPEADLADLPRLAAALAAGQSERSPVISDEQWRSRPPPVL